MWRAGAQGTSWSSLSDLRAESLAEPAGYRQRRVGASVDNRPSVAGVPEPERSASNQISKMREYDIIDTNAESIGGCSFCGYKDANSLGHRRKTDWLKERYAEGLRFKVLRSRRFGDIGVIEYALGNHA